VIVPAEREISRPEYEVKLKSDPRYKPTVKALKSAGRSTANFVVTVT